LLVWHLICATLRNMGSPLLHLILALFILAGQRYLGKWKKHNFIKITDLVNCPFYDIQKCGNYPDLTCGGSHDSDEPLLRSPPVHLSGEELKR